ncbi:LacI family DNA-binding transcriptional regulator [Sphingorhabdus sp.]|jgi:DNA-binding LacI/PurR family transcriptional regulator|uniref:LacI family DNA-binding transcriptional regulator n=2 Tax=Sphingorhabdus sp. TaxID=1902408 RepID=UPI003BB17E01|nr:LacI family DNA-binding transcriptional regulator [Sphingomonadales bacterium]MBL0021514.1 LacI family DNA-binding transcriptional regulator [Sphingomonadales bacterium]
MTMRVTAYDVAERAGVTQPTVSRALSGSPLVSDATRERVVKAAQELGYVINLNATRLRSGRTQVLAVVLIGREGERPTATNPFYFSLLGAIGAAAAEREYDLLVSFQHSADNFYADYQDARQADGMIVIGTTRNDEAWQYFRSRDHEGKAWVCWGAPDDDLRWVRSDNERGGQLAADYLYNQGRRKPVFVGSLEPGQRQFTERYEGFAEAWRKLGVEPHLVETDPALAREEQGARAIDALLSEGKDFDGLFAASDLIALGALDGLAKAGIAVPDAVSVVGFDGIRTGAYSSPPLTTIESDFDLAGRMLVKNVLGRIEGEPPESRRVPVHLVVRGS